MIDTERSNPCKVRLEAWALSQHGVITTDQAHRLGVESRFLARNDAWTRIVPGLYRLTAQEPSWQQDLMASVLGAGRGAVASHRSAALLHHLDGARKEVVEITVPHDLSPPKRSGVKVHRVTQLDRIDRDKVGNIPVTTVTRTIIDLGAVVDAATVELALESGLRSRRTSLFLLNQRLEAVGGRGRPGTATLRRLLASRLYQAPTGSELETLFVQLCRRYHLPEGTRQHQVSAGGRVSRVDFAWEEQKLLVELEGYERHGTPADHRRDMQRQNAVLRHRPGWTLLRFGWCDVAERTGQVAAELAAALEPRRRTDRPARSARRPTRVARPPVTPPGLLPS